MAELVVDRIVTRMYRIGTGDCLVLKFFSGETVTFKMMVDCGACRGDSARFTEFVNHIKDYTGSELDLLVVTHEHLDHIIGFSRAREVFDQMKIAKVWVGWTEDPSNRLAQRLQQKYGKHVQALAVAVDRLDKRINSAEFESIYEPFFLGERIIKGKKFLLEALEGAVGLYRDAGMAAAGSGGEMKRAMDYVLKTLSERTGEPPFYCYPGKKTPLLKGTAGIRFYVLGPPQDEGLLTKEEIKDEVYERKIMGDNDMGFISALAADDPMQAQSARPFSAEYEVKAERKKEILEGHFGQRGKEDNRWRNIDFDWLCNAGALAIRLERYINNTSVVLAIEFGQSGKVILLPGDAQSGNWKSWHAPSLTWKIQKDGKERTVTANDLLARTVLYKVGHHVSHNGTASQHGLDLMVSDELTALATLDYNNIHPGWKNTMPGTGLYKELISRTKGRVFRIDEGLITEAAAKAERDRWSPVEREAFEKGHVCDEKYIEWTVFS